MVKGWVKMINRILQIKEIDLSDGLAEEDPLIAEILASLVS